MLITPVNIDIASRGFNKLYQDAYDAAESFYQEITSVVPSNSRENLYGWMQKLPRMREWLGDRVYNNLAAAEYIIRNKKWELTVKVGRDEFEDDTYGVYNPVVQDMGNQARLHPDDLIANLLLNGEALPGTDGQNHFDTDHAVNPKKSSMGFQANYIASGKPLTADNFAFVRAKMMGLKGEDGKPLKVRPTALVVPPSLEVTAKQIVNMTTVVQGGSNVLLGMAKVIVIDDLEEEPDAWYLMDTRRPIKPFVFQQRKAPNFVALTSLTDPNVVHYDDYIWGVDTRDNAGYGPWFLSYKARA